jgi:hypothetical protein
LFSSAQTEVQQEQKRITSRRIRRFMWQSENRSERDEKKLSKMDNGASGKLLS